MKKCRQTRLILIFKFGKSPTFQPVHRVSFAVNRGIYEHEKLKKKKVPKLSEKLCYLKQHLKLFKLNSNRFNYIV